MYKIAVIDDEPKIRRGISNMLRTSFLGKAVITDFSTVYDILEFTGRERIDILITDICMPDMDGLILARKLKSYHSDIKIIVISGYSDFEYAKAAISLQVCEYLLKPVEPDQLIKTVAQAMERLERERGGNCGTDREESDHKTSLLKAVMQNKETILRKEAEWLRFAPPYCIVMQEEQKEEVGREQVTPLMVFLKESASACEVLGERQQLYLIAGTDKIDELYSLTEAFTGHEEWNFNLGFGICDSLEKLHQAYREALDAVKQAVYSDGECGHIYRCCGPGVWNFDAGKEALLILNRLCSKEEYTDLLNKMKRELHLAKPCYDALERGIEDFLTQLLSVFEKDDAMGTICTALADMKEQFFGYENLNRFFDDLDRLLAEAGSQISNVRNMRSEQNMKKAIAYIEKNYRYDLSLEEVAQQAHFNPSYFSSYFKKYTGMSLINYMMELRLKKAKELLKDPDIKIMEITKELGFHDSRYFAKIFKKSVGVTPSEYRSIMQQINKEAT